MSSRIPTAADKEFEMFVTAVRASLVQRAQRIVRDPAEAEDIVQDTLAAMWPMWTGNPPRNPQAYAHRAVSLNAIKRMTRARATVSVEHAQLAETQQGDEPRNDPLALERALAVLPPAQQIVIRLRFYVGLSMTEIGTQLSISSNTVASRCRYALLLMRKVLTTASVSTPHRKERHERPARIKSPDH
jgi:RNA polymerase sigma factor (sigma-70 family)